MRGAPNSSEENKIRTQEVRVKPLRMHITKVKIRNYRSLAECDIDFLDGLNILVGDNEAGKSTLLEAISLALTGSLNGRPIAQELHPFLFSLKATLAYLTALHSGAPMPAAGGSAARLAVSATR
jgi:predicted ATPase